MGGDSCHVEHKRMFSFMTLIVQTFHIYVKLFLLSSYFISTEGKLPKYYLKDNTCSINIIYLHLESLCLCLHVYSHFSCSW